MDTGKYIKQLLQEQKSVILPGFGTLVLKDSGPELSSSGYKLTPPGLAIKFDASYSKDDEKLASLYAAADGISPEEAKQQLLEFIDEVKFALDKGEKYVIDEVGVFFRDEDQRVLFDIDPGWIIDPDQYGLDSIELLELDDDYEDDQQNIHKEGHPDDSDDDLIDIGEMTSHFPPAPSVKEPETSRESRKKWRIIYIIVASLIVIFTVIVLIPVNYEDGKGIRFGKEGITLNQTDTDKDTQQKLPESIIEEITPPVNEQPEVIKKEEIVEETAVEKNRYFIIAGSFNNLLNASDLQDALRAEGFPSEIIITENKRYRVTLVSYSSKSEAIKELNILKKQDKYLNYWVLSN